MEGLSKTNDKSKQPTQNKQIYHYYPYTSSNSYRQTFVKNLITFFSISLLPISPKHHKLERICDEFLLLYHKLDTFLYGVYETFEA